MRQTEHALFWRTPTYPDMDMLRATYITHSFARHFHETYALGVIERGTYTFYHAGKMRVITAGQIVIINPGEIHSGNAVDADGWRYRMFYPGAILMRQIAQEMTGRVWSLPYFPQCVVDDPMVARQLCQLHLLLEQTTDRMAHDAAFRLAFGALIERHAIDKPGPVLAYSRRDMREIVRSAQTYIQSHLDQSITLNDVATACGVSAYHIAKVFKDETGLPPHQYLNNVRIMQARHLLRTGQPIADVAYATGFTDQSHLTRWFKRIVGVPPGKFSNTRV